MLGQMVAASTLWVCGGNGQLVDKKPARLTQEVYSSKEEVFQLIYSRWSGRRKQLSMSGKGNETQRIAGDLLIVIEEVEGH